MTKTVTKTITKAATGPKKTKGVKSAKASSMGRLSMSARIREQAPIPIPGKTKFLLASAAGISNPTFHLLGKCIDRKFTEQCRSLIYGAQWVAAVAGRKGVKVSDVQLAHQLMNSN